MLVQCWPAVYDVGPTFSQRFVGALYSLGMCINVYGYILAHMIRIKKTCFFLELNLLGQEEYPLFFYLHV